MSNYTKIKTFNDACKVLKKDPKKLPIVKGIPKEHQKAIVANYKLRIIAEALNKLDNGKSWKPDYKNADEYKYEPWFIKDEKASGFSYARYGWYAATYVGSRLVYREWDISKYAATQFKSLYNDFLKY